MSNDLIWILTGVFVCIAAGAGGFLAIQKQMGELRSFFQQQIGSVRERVVAIEVTLEIFGRKTAKILHSPHDPYGIDSLLDKYLDRHYELSMADWASLKARCEEIESRETVSKDERFLAAMLATVCMHKMKLDPPLRRTIDVATNKAEDNPS